MFLIYYKIQDKINHPVPIGKKDYFNSKHSIISRKL